VRISGGKPTIIPARKSKHRLERSDAGTLPYSSCQRSSETVVFLNVSRQRHHLGRRRKASVQSSVFRRILVRACHQKRRTLVWKLFAYAGAAILPATRCSRSVRAVIAANGNVASPAGRECGSNNNGLLAVAIKHPPSAGRRTLSVNGPTASGAMPRVGRIRVRFRSPSRTRFKPPPSTSAWSVVSRAVGLIRLRSTIGSRQAHSVAGGSAVPRQMFNFRRFLMIDNTSSASVRFWALIHFPKTKRALPRACRFSQRARSIWRWLGGTQTKNASVR